jgi:hypothetical protein
MPKQPRNLHPYKQFEGSNLWRCVEKQIAALVKNSDLKELTARKYIVGSICQSIAGGRTKRT